MRELLFVWYAGMIRGAIAFGLVLRIDGRQYKNRDVIVTTSLSLVVFTTIFYGSTVGILSSCLFKTTEPESSLKEDRKHGTLNETLESVDLSGSDSSYQQLLHPN